MALPGATEFGNRIGTTALKRIYDDDRDGAADSNPVTQILADAKSMVFGYLRGIYDLAQVESSPPNEVNRLILDVAEAYAAKRHPEVVRRDWVAMLTIAINELKDLRSGKTRLDVVGAPEPAANEGADFNVGNPETFDATTYKRTFGDGFGDF